MSLASAQFARTKPDEIAVRDERVALSWRQLDPMLNRATNALIAEDLVGEQRIAVFAPNSAEAVIAYLTAILAGISSVPVNFHLTADEVTYILEQSDARLLFVGPETLETGLAAAARVGAKVVGWRCEGPGVMAWNDWIAAGADREPPTETLPRPHLHFTSGTTGQPKGTDTPPTYFPRMPTMTTLFESFRNPAVPIAMRSPTLVVSPLYHIGPLGTVRSLGGGAPLVIMSRFDAETTLANIDRYGIRSTVMVPTQFQRLLALPQAVRDRYDVSSLKYVSHTGAACPVVVKRQMIDWFGPVLYEAYGASEAGTTNAISSQDWLRKPGSVGQSQPPFEAVIIGEDGSLLGPNQVGALYFRDITGRGIVYHKDPEKTAAAHIEPGVFTLGEVGYIDDEGFVFITDRSSDMIVSGGVNIYPAEIEKVLVQHPDVADVAVVAAPNADMGEEVKALVIPRDPASPPLPGALDAFVRQHLAGYKTPRSYEFVDDIGRNAMGKINKKELRRRFWPTDRTIG